MKEHPILFTLANVLSILAEVKTQTRRVVKYEYTHGCFTGDCPHDKQVECDASLSEYAHTECPYGVIGDHLWVREGFLTRGSGTHVVYRNDYTREYGVAEAAGFGAMYGGWKSPLFMPRKFCRLILAITDVRVERVQKISEEDCIAEGCPKEYLLGINWYKDLWDSINGKTHPWKRNPWCWCISFRRI